MKGTIAVLAVAVVTTTGIASGAAAATAARPPAFGYHEIRAGIPSKAPRFRVSSPELKGGTFPARAYSNDLGCTGENAAPTLTWSGAPSGTKSFAVTMFDRDAPTGSGFWHWTVHGIPASATGVPADAVAGLNDAGNAGYLGPCPPQGDRPHRYELTVLALDVADAGIAADASPALASFTLSSHVIGYARLTATAQRR